MSTSMINWVPLVPQQAGTSMISSPIEVCLCSLNVDKETVAGNDRSHDADNGAVERCK